MATAAIPAVLGRRFEVEKELAKGGMATVYLAHDRELNGPAAIKVLAPRLAHDPELMERFRAEAVSIHELHHPNIIEVYACTEEQSTAYIAMRFVPGGTLKDLLNALGGPMDLHTAARVTAQVASALQHAHDHGMVHLDVKPGNVLLGNADWPLLSDFGIIRIAGDKREEGQRVAGTPAYMSPEQWEGGDVDGRSDEYSLGLMFYEMVTGRRPFTGETSAQLRAQHVSEPPPRPRQINPGIPGPVEEVILRALEKRPEDRYPRIEDFGAALLESVDRSRGMQLETKQMIVGAVPNVLALLVLSTVAPLLEALPNKSLPVFRQLTLDWPIALVIAIMQIALLLGIRWHLVGLATRLFGAVVDSIDRFTRMTVRLGSDTQGPLHVERWRNRAVSAAEGLVNVAYLFLIYQLAALPVINTVSLAVDPSLEDLIATAVTALVLLVVAVIVLRMLHDTGPIMAVCALAICWALVSALPVIDRQVFGGVSLQWVVKLAIGLAVLAAFVGIRGRVQLLVRDLTLPIIVGQIRALRRGTVEEEAQARRQVEATENGLINAIYLVVGYAIIAVPLNRVLTGLLQDTVGGLILTIAVILAVAALINTVRASGGVVTAVLGLVICTPTLFGLPLFGDGFGGGSYGWLARLILGIAILGLFISVRRRVQHAVQPIVVPFLGQQVGAIRPAKTEGEQAQRRKLIESASNALVDVLYLIVGYFAVVAPVAAAVRDNSQFANIGSALYVLFVLAVVFVLWRFIRDLLPRRSAPSAAVAVSAS
ncbi:MAG TPA: serine/threonine-protein kinase [Chloroflexota bacterium]|nr:serine/threonine-protein kinase [Chloroflexota bacterium]